MWPKAVPEVEADGATEAERQVAYVAEPDWPGPQSVKLLTFVIRGHNDHHGVVGQAVAVGAVAG